MRLEVDIGNTFLKWRVVDQQEVVAKGACLTQQIDHTVFADVQAFAIDKVLIGSVAGHEINAALEVMVEAIFGVKPLFAKVTASCSGVVNSYVDPSKMGVDRWLAMVAAYKQAGSRVAVVDCGSAITVDYVSAQGEHEGGYIIPGLRLMREALLKNTAQVRFDPLNSSFTTAPGKSTAQAVEGGTAFVFQALAEKLAKDLHDPNNTKLYITGGDGALLSSLMGVGEYNEALVLDGLAWVCSDA